MKLPPIKRLTKEDFPDAPHWIDRLLYALNIFLNAIYSGLNKNITLDENIDCQKVTFQVTAGAAAANNTAKFTLSLSHAPSMVILGKAVTTAGNYAPIAAAVHLDWSYDGTNISIDAITGLTNGTTYNLTVLVF